MLGTTAGGFTVDFDLVSHDGDKVTVDSFPGKILLVYFGFTHCLEVCPRNASKLSGVLEQLGARAENVAPLFISVDPVRDTPAVLKDYLSQNFPLFTGLTGSHEQIDAAKNSFRVFSRPRPGQDDTYQVAHTSFTYVVADKQVITHFTDSTGAEAVEQGLTSILMKNSRPRHQAELSEAVPEEGSSQGHCCAAPMQSLRPGQH